MLTYDTLSVKVVFLRLCCSAEKFPSYSIPSQNFSALQLTLKKLLCSFLYQCDTANIYYIPLYYILTDYSLSPQGFFNYSKPNARLAGCSHISSGTDMELTNCQPLGSISTAWNRAQATQQQGIGSEKEGFKSLL